MPSASARYGAATHIAGMVWRRLDVPGHESLELFQHPGAWLLHGVVVVAHASASALEYEIECDPHWRTSYARIDTLLERDRRSVELARDSTDSWTVNGIPRPDLEGCTDIDLGFSPSTNLLPIRRLALEVESEAEVRAAWVQFPGLTVTVLEQRYRRLHSNTYRYESAGGNFRRDLLVNAHGLVIDYPGLWTAEG